MKKKLLFCLGIGITAAAFAQSEPVILSEFYSQRISPDGNVIVSEGFESTEIYNVAADKRTSFESFRLGSGNCVSGDGSILVVNTESDIPVLIINGEEQDVSSITEVYQSSNFNAITADGSRIAGWVFNQELTDESNDPDAGSTMYVPMYVDLAKDGTLGEVKLLPYPKTDWLGKAPQYVTASYISNNGKTILGFVMDNSGMAVYPIVYKESADGEWSYTLPTESLINPNKLPFPEDPGDFDVTPIEFQDYMTEDEYAAYQKAYEDWVAGGYQGEYPEESNYMTEEEKAAYNEAVDIYNEKAKEYNEKFEKYYEDLSIIQQESTFFLQNGYAMDPEGKIVALASEKEYIIENEESEWPEFETHYPTYILDLESLEIKEVKDMGTGRYPIPGQVLSNGTVIASTPQPRMWDALQLPPQGYVLLPGAEQYIPVEEQLAIINPEAVAWLENNYKKSITIGYNWETEEELKETMLMTGHICVSDDWSVVSGGVLAYLINSGEEVEEGEEEPNTLESYVIQSDISGVSAIAVDSKLENVKYYDINGLEVKNPEKGIYIVRSIYSDGSVKTSKAVIR